MHEGILESSVRAHLKEWIVKLSILALSLSTLTLAYLYSQPLASAILPALLAELVHFYVVTRALIKVEDDAVKKELLKEILDSMGCMLFKTMQMAYWLEHINVFTLTVFPLLLVSVLKRFMKTSDQCHSLSNFVIGLIRWSGTITLFIIGLKLDGIIVVNWYLSLLPIWLLLGMLFVISLGILLLFLATISTYLSDEATFLELFGLFWFFISSFGFSMTMWYFLHCIAIGYNFLYPILPLLSFLGVYIVLTVAVFNPIVRLFEMLTVGNPVRDIYISRVVEKKLRLLKQISSSFYRRTEGESGENEAPEHENGMRNCGICYSTENNAVFMECGHGGFCYQCAIENWKKKGCCPLCRSPIASVLEIKQHQGGVFRVVASSRAEII